VVRAIHLIHEAGAQDRAHSAHATPGPLGSSNLSCGQPTEFDVDAAMWIAVEQPVVCPQHLSGVTLIDDGHATVGVPIGVSIALKPEVRGPTPALVSSGGAGTYALLATPCGLTAGGVIDVAGTSYRAQPGTALPPERAGDCLTTETAVLSTADRLILSAANGSRWVLRRHLGRIVSPCG